jgi:hypothetical protein
MTALNENLQTLPAKWAKEFIGVPERQLLPAGTKLCKRVTAQKEFNRFSEWWILKKDWDIQTQRGAAISVSPEQVTRAHQAVSNDWQENLQQMVHAQLMQPVYAWIGRARWQPLNSTDTKVILIGGGMQICIPNLTSSHLRVLHSV